MLRGVILQASKICIFYGCMGIYCLVSFHFIIVMECIIFGIFMFVEKSVLDTSHTEKRKEKSLLSQCCREVQRFLTVLMAKPPNAK